MNAASKTSAWREGEREMAVWVILRAAVLSVVLLCSQPVFLVCLLVFIWCLGSFGRIGHN